MKFSVSWLAELTGLELEAEDLARRLTAAGLEVDTVEPAAQTLDGVEVGEIIAAKPHPEADRLQVCQVRASAAEPVQIVCGAPNARVGLKAPLATVGARLPGDMKIRKAKLRGVESYGMLCSAKELGLSEDAAGLMELSAATETGQALRYALALDDHVVVLELTPNRSDCLGMYGLARECSALFGHRWEIPQIEPVVAEIDEQRDVQLMNPEGCPRYLGRVVRNVDVGAPAPMWMRERLRRSGVRSISAVVDITNYVLLELGQPMHAFDLDRLQGGIHVRWAEAGEQVTLLDDSEVELLPEHLVIADDSGVVAMAGLMGGANSAVSDHTQHIFFESAWFAPAAIMGRARDLGMATDAAHRFERGIDPAGQRRAMERATRLLIDICGGEPGPIVEAVAEEHLPARPVIELRESRLALVIGIPIEPDRVGAILHDLGMRVERTAEGWRVTPPSARLDLAMEVDLIEEVARVFGYDNIPSRTPGGQMQPQPLNEEMLNLSRIRNRLCDSGYFEAVTYSFVDRRLLETFSMAEQVIELANPISQDMDVMRPSLIPGLVQALVRNVHHRQPRVRLFEAGVCFDAQGGERERLAAVCFGAAQPRQWGSSNRAVDFFDCKGDLEGLLELSSKGNDDIFMPETQPWLHPGQAAAMYRGGESLGWIGAVHPAILQALDIEGQIYAFEMDLRRFQRRQLPKYQTFSRLPGIRRDLSLLVPEAVTAAELLQAINSQGGTVLRDVAIFDLYQGPGVEKDYKSLAMGLILQKDCSTLTDSDADEFVARLMEELRAQLGVSLRG